MGSKGSPQDPPAYFASSSPALHTRLLGLPLRLWSVLVACALLKCEVCKGWKRLLHLVAQVPTGALPFASCAALYNSLNLCLTSSTFSVNGTITVKSQNLLPAEKP